jgi:putative redox protein
MSQTAKLYAARKGWQIDEIEVQLTFERFRGSDYPAFDGSAAFVHEIREHVVIRGDLTQEQIGRVREIMGKCPVRRLLSYPVFFVEGQPVVI